MGFNLNANFVLPPNPNWRQFRLKLKDKTFIKSRKRIRTAAELSEWVKQYDPTDVYVTTSCWLAPELLGPKRLATAGYKCLSLSLLRSDFFLDFDSKDYGWSIEAAYREMIKVYEYLKDRYSDFTFVRTGKGFHCWIHDWYNNLKKIPRPIDRVEYVKQQKVRLVDELKSRRFRWDFMQSINVFQIARVWNSWHRNGTLVEYSKNIFTKKLLFPTLYDTRQGNLKEGNDVIPSYEGVGLKHTALCEGETNGRSCVVKGTPMPPLQYFR